MLRATVRSPVSHIMPMLRWVIGNQASSWFWELTVLHFRKLEKSSRDIEPELVRNDSPVFVRYTPVQNLRRSARPLRSAEGSLGPSTWYTAIVGYEHSLYDEMVFLVNQTLSNLTDWLLRYYCQRTRTWEHTQIRSFYMTYKVARVGISPTMIMSH